MKTKFTILLSFILLFLTACNSNESTPDDKNESAETVTYESENGPIEIPKHPKRIVALSYAPNIHSLGVDMIGVDKWSKENPLFNEALADVETVSEEDIESVLALEPDLIIAGTHMKNLEELEKIAPTVAFTWGKLDYLEQQIEIGKIVGKEDEAKEWAADFETKAAKVGEQVKEKHGEDLSVTMYETNGKNFYLFGEAWGRGTEIIYQAMDLTMPENVQKEVSEQGYAEISQEVIPDYAGDFMILSRYEDTDLSFMKDDVWKSIPAVQKEQVIEIDTAASSYSDPTTLDYLLDLFQEELTK